MNAYFFTGRFWTPQQERRPGFESYSSTTIYGGTEDEARERFISRWLESPDNPGLEIRQVVGTQFGDCMLTEEGQEPIDWPKAEEQAERMLGDADPSLSMDEGYWADGNTLVDPNNLSRDLETLRKGLPGDVSSGLNWSEERQFFFIISIIALEPSFLSGAADPKGADGEDGLESEDELLEEEDLPAGLMEKEAAVLVRARNSIVAVWLWRKFAAGDRLSHHPIQIDPWCSAISVESPDSTETPPEPDKAT